MSGDDERRERWLAYLLGEASPEKHDDIEAEMRHAPEEAAALRAVVEGVSRWAKAPVPYLPANVGELCQGLSGASRERGQRRRSFRAWRRWAIAAAAMALLVLAASQARFSVSIGDVTFRWRQEVPSAKESAHDEQSLELAERIQRLEEVTEIVAGQVESLALQNAAIQEQLRTAAVRLAYSQRAEAEARYRDIEGLLQLTNGRVRDVRPAADKKR
jgi:hypothetical protein